MIQLNSHIVKITKKRTSLEYGKKQRKRFIEGVEMVVQYYQDIVSVGG